MGNWAIIQTDKEYKEVMKRVEQLSQHLPLLKSAEGRELMLLGYLANQYEEKVFPITMVANEPTLNYKKTSKSRKK